VLISALLPLYVRARVALRARVRADGGQTTAEYALVLVGVAAVALLVVAWAGDTNKIGRLFDGVLDSILEQLP